MKLRNLRKDERGDITVLVALCMTVLLGITAGAVDFGMLASCKGSLQNAADAAALAAAAELGTGRSYTQVSQTAREYCAENGFDPAREDVTIDVRTVGDQVTVTLERDMPMGFSKVLTGKSSEDVRAAATAEVTSIFGACPYAMFAGQRIEDSGAGITITGNDISIDGNIHSNSDISMPHATLTAGSVATAVRNVSPATAGWNGNSIALDMPSFRSFQSAFGSMPEVVEFSGNITKNSQSGFAELIHEAIVKYHTKMGALNFGFLSEGLFIHISGDLTFNGNSSTAYNVDFPIILVVDGDIDLNGATLNSTYGHPLNIMSKNGDITVNGGGATYTGILYAPGGDITLNGNDAEFVGSIVAQNIWKNGGKISVTYQEDTDRFLPRTKVHLIN